MKKQHRNFHRKNITNVPSGEIFINKNYCDGCGVCVETCPTDVLMLKELTDKEIDELTTMGKIKVRFKGKEKSFVKNIESCTFCGLCEKNCHESAIVVGR